jgi:O-antigen ligase
MTGPVVQRTQAEVRPLVRNAVFAACAGVFLVFAYASARTWSDVQRGFTEGFGRDLVMVTQSSQGGNAQRQVAGLLLGLLGLAMLAAPRAAARLRPTGTLGAALGVYLAVLVSSVGWSTAPDLTGRRVLSFLMMAAAVAGVARLLPGRALVSFAAFATLAYLGVAIAAELARGAFHPLARDYRFSGVYHPNTVGSFCAVLVMAAVASERWRGRRWIPGAAIAVGTVVLLLTRSRTALGGLVLALAVRWVLAARAPRRLLALAACAWLALAALFVFDDALVASAPSAVLMARGDSDVETLSGRTALWSMLLSYWGDRPLLGHGLGGFWTPRHIQQIYLAQRWPVSEAHSTYLDLLLDTGVVGLASYLLVLGAALWRAARRYLRRRDGPDGFIVLLLVYFTTAGALETLQPSPGFLTFLFFWALSLLAFPDPSAEPSSPCAST